MNQQTRRHFLLTAARGGAGLLVAPSLAPLLNANPRARRNSALGTIQVAQIGCGRMGRGDLQAILKVPLARVVAVCDLDTTRLAAAKQLAEEFYRKQGEANVAVRACRDHRELLALPEIDAVVVSTPDHTHAIVAIEAAIAGKHLYVQKPITYDVSEAIALRKAVLAKGVVLQTGSQQRSDEPWSAFRIAAAAVRNGRIGRLRSIRIGLGVDVPSGRKPAPMEVPPNLDYERWLGAAPEQPYMEGRVHPQGTLEGRPGWITTEAFGLGMITNWGAHHVDIAQWAMGEELGGPLTAEGRADFMTDDVWTVHRGYHVELTYRDEVRVVIDDGFAVGLEFEGDEGTLFCARGEATATASDPNAPSAAVSRALRASDAKILEPLGERAIVLPPSRNHYVNWIECIRDRREPVAPIAQSARSLTACYIAWLSMKLGRKLRWDPTKERFLDDEEANARLGRRARRDDYDVALAMKKAGLE